MKKIFVLFAALAVMAACNKSETVVTETPNELGFSVSSFNPTKAGELNGSTFDNKDYAMYVSASQYKANGVEENPLFFNDELFMNAGGAPDWHHYAAEGAASPSPIYWPIGGSRIDFLAYALPKGRKAAIPAPVFNAATAAQDFTVTAWDTYANQVDLLYAAANGQTSLLNGVAPNYVKMTFDHAQALLIFNVKIDKATTGLVINDIAFVNDDYVRQRNVELQAGTAPGATTEPIASEITLKTLGTFKVDNLRNNLVADWSDLRTVTGHWKMPSFAGTPAKSDCNISGVSSAVDYGTALTSATLVQLGESLLIPEQPAQNFVVTYTVGSGASTNTMQYVYNVKRNGWQAGKKYIYNLDIRINEIVITESVHDFDDAYLGGDPVLMD